MAEKQGRRLPAGTGCPGRVSAQFIPGLRHPRDERAAPEAKRVRHLGRPSSTRPGRVCRQVPGRPEAARLLPLAAGRGGAEFHFLSRRCPSGKRKLGGGVGAAAQ